MEITLNLPDIVSCEARLGKRKVTHYQNKGIDYLIDSIRAKGACEGVITENGIKYELTDCCHRCRALYELGHTQVTMAYHGIAPRSNVFGGPLGKVPLLNEQEYARWYQETTGNPLPEWA